MVITVPPKPSPSTNTTNTSSTKTSSTKTTKTSSTNTRKHLQKSVAVRNVERGEIWLQEYLVHHKDKVRDKKRKYLERRFRYKNKNRLYIIDRNTHIDI